MKRIATAEATRKKVELMRSRRLALQKATEEKTKRIAEDKTKRNARRRVARRPVVSAEPSSANSSSDMHVCTDPVQFYSDCTFTTVVSSMKMEEGMTLKTIENAPGGVLVPVGCRASLFTKSSKEFSNNKESHAMIIKGDDRKHCLSALKQPAVAIELNHDIDHAKMAKEVMELKAAFHKLKTDMRAQLRRL